MTFLFVTLPILLYLFDLILFKLFHISPDFKELSIKKFYLGIACAFILIVLFIVDKLIDVRKRDNYSFQKKSVEIEDGVIDEEIWINFYNFRHFHCTISNVE